MTDLAKACAVVGGGVAALAAAVLTNTERGRKINKNLDDAYDVFDKKVSKYLPLKKNSNKYLEEV